MDPNVRVGARYVHRCGRILRVIGQRVPGDRSDELRVHCEVVSDPTGFYEPGHRDGWHLLSVNGWEQLEE